MPVIANTTIISNFASVRQLQLLQLLWKKIYLSDQVFNEIQAGLMQGYEFYDGIEQLIFPFSQTGWLHLTAPNTMDEFRTLAKLLEKLHSGEASCLAIAHHRHWVFLSDDKAARKAAVTLDVPFSGTIGVLISLAKHNHLSLSEADMILLHMVKLGYRSPVTSLRQILQESL
jgi:predicted nucleic acid-binding protein